MAHTSAHTAVRPPVITIMGHIDHGKSTLLDYIRKTESVAAEAGGITQHLGAYEVEHNDRRLTFLDTPGHEAFAALRSRGAAVADIAILIIAADDGVKAQTIEALECIKAAELPFVVAMNKTDVAGADIERIKQELAEHGIYVEGYGGQISWVPISAKSGDGIPDLLDLLILTADIAELSGDPKQPAEGVVIEANIDPKRGTTATLLIKNGTLESGSFVAAGGAVAPVRLMENDRGERIETASFSTPVRVVGFSDVPAAGSAFSTFSSKKDAEAATAAYTDTPAAAKSSAPAEEDERFIASIIVKADVANSLDAIAHEIQKLESEYVLPRIMGAGVGSIGENDIRAAGSSEHTIIAGFNTSIEPRAAELAEREGVPVATFDIIYELTEWLGKTIEGLRPKVTEEEIHGTLRVIKTFSSEKDAYVIGGRVENGALRTNEQVYIERTGERVGEGRITNLQRGKQETDHIDAGSECGVRLTATVAPAPGDVITSFTHVEK